MKSIKSASACDQGFFRHDYFIRTLKEPGQDLPALCQHPAGNELSQHQSDCKMERPTLELQEHVTHEDNHFY